MARKRLSSVKRPQGRNTSISKISMQSKNDTSISAVPVTDQVMFDKEDIASKLIPLGIPTAREAKKNAERAIENVLTAITCVIGEGDLSIAGFGDFRAVKGPGRGEITFTFTPHDKLIQAVEARLSALS